MSAVIPPLLNKSYYSFLSSTLSIKDIVDFAVKWGHKHVVISDFQSAHSWIKFYKEARKNSLIPVFSLHLNYNNSSFLLIAKNKLGYLNLIKIASNFEIEKSLLNGLILIHLEGDDDLDHEEKYVANVEDKNGVYVRENKFLEDSDFNFYCLLKAISNNSTLSSEISLNQLHSKDFLNFSPNLSKESIQIKNVYEILNKCELYEIIEDFNCLNFFSDPKLELRKILDELFQKSEFVNNAEYAKRLDYEFDVLVKKGFCEYFLIVYDAIKWAKENDIAIGPGRGSVCGSLVAFILNITEVDPIKYDLYFERFLNLERTIVPDIDIDVDNQKRHLLFSYLRNKYGENNVSFISTYQTFKIKNSIREVSKAMEISQNEVDFCLKNISNFHNIDLTAVDTYPTSLKRLFINHPNLKDYVCRLHGFPKSLSIHAAGLIISVVPLNSLIPFIKGTPLNIVQWSADDLKEFGLIKFDFLALQYLSFISNLQKKTGVMDLKSINLNDLKVYSTFIDGHNSFIFQFENPKVKSLVKQYKPKSILDISLLSALNRPGALDQIPVLLARKSSANVLNVRRTDIHEILNDTYGLLIYQEQLLKIVSFYTNCSFWEADTFRRDLSVDEEKCKTWFTNHFTNKKYDQLDLIKVWNDISKFANYSFNKSHAVAYSLISYRLLWFKTYYPEVFYSELLKFSIEEENLFEIQSRGFGISHPVYGKSLSNEFHVHKNTFYFPVSKISGLPQSFIENYSKIEGKARNTLEAIRDCVNSGFADQLTIKLLIKIGFFNRLFIGEESEHFWESNLESVYESIVYVDKNNEPIFDLHLYPYETSKEIKDEYRKFRKDNLGVDFSKPKISPSIFEKFPNVIPIYSLTYQQDSVQNYIGFVSSCRDSKTFRDIPFLWLRISDNFYTSPNIAYFEDDTHILKKAAANSYAILASIEKKKDFYKIVKIHKIFEKYD